MDNLMNNPINVDDKTKKLILDCLLLNVALEWVEIIHKVGAPKTFAHSAARVILSLPIEASGDSGLNQMKEAIAQEVEQLLPNFQLNPLTLINLLRIIGQSNAGQSSR